MKLTRIIGHATKGLGAIVASALLQAVVDKGTDVLAKRRDRRRVDREDAAGA